MPFGVIDDSGWVASPTDVMGAGESMFAYDLADPILTRAGVGGPAFPSDAGLGSTGFTRIATGYDSAMPAPGTGAATDTTWKSALDWQHSPTFWVLAFALAAVGFLYARVEVAGRAGRFGGHAGITI